MKKIEFNDLPAGSIVAVKEYNLWERFKAKLCKKELPYNNVLIDPFGYSWFLFKNSWWVKYNVTCFIPKKQYSNKEKNKLFDNVVVPNFLQSKPIETLVSINTVRPDTFYIHKQHDTKTDVTVDELLENNKYYSKYKIK